MLVPTKNKMNKMAELVEEGGDFFVSRKTAGEITDKNCFWELPPFDARLQAEASCMIIFTLPWV